MLGWRHALTISLVWLTWVGLLAPRGASASAAAAEPEVAVFPVQVQGEVEAHALEQLATSLEDGLSRSSVPMMPAAELLERFPAAASCAEPSCAAKALAAAGVELGVRATIVVDGRDYVILVEVLAVEDGALLQKREASCEICGTAEIAEQLSNEVAAVVPFVVDYARGRAILEVRSSPRGARVIVDGREVGVTPFSGEALPGDRNVEVVLAGHAPRERQVAVAKGTTTIIDVELEAIERDEEQGPHPALGWAPIGVGAGAIGGGLALIILEEDQVASRCDDPSNIDANGTCRYRYKTLEGGIVMAGVGVALVVAGAVVLGIRAKRGRSGGGRAALRPTLGGLALRF